jgi:hypothetical protein
MMLTLSSNSKRKIEKLNFCKFPGSVSFALSLNFSWVSSSFNIMPCDSLQLNFICRTGANDLSLNPDGSAVNPRAMQQHIRNDSHLMNLLLQVNYYYYYSRFY